MRKMEIRLLATIGVGLLVCIRAFGLEADIGPASKDTARRLVEQGLNHRVWERLKPQMLSSGRVTTNKEAVYELASGMYYKDANGKLAEARELIEIAPGGTSAVATHGQHKVTFANNLNSFGAITLQIDGT